MKKTLFLLATFCATWGFIACSSDDGGSNPPAPVISNKSIVNGEPLSLIFNQIDAPFHQIVFSETGKAVIGPLARSAADSKRRIQGDGETYIIGTFKTSGNTYTVFDEEGKEYCTLVVESTAGKTTTVQIRMKSGSEIEETVFEGEASIGEKVPVDEITATLCREWTVSSTRLRHHDGVTAVKHFENAVEAASLNAILDYAKSVASIDESFDPDMTITSIEFISTGTFCIYFKNKEHYIGKWSWTDKDNGYIHYSWNSANMGNSFENGEAVFDIRKFQKVNYYTLTLGAEITSGGKTYQIELSFYLNEK